MIRDDFAGPGGWDVALAALGRTDVIGVETDAAACAAARAAGHVREHRDVRHHRHVRRYTGGLEGYVASPPCQTFSAAGKGHGRAALEHLGKAARMVAEGATPEDAVAAVADDALDERSVLVLEPLLVVRDHRPTWVALEQVAPVLPVWEGFADVLREWGYSVVTGVLNAEQYGVPQTRRRAVLMAHRERQVALPEPTHSRYYPRDPGRQDLGVEPWVPMADALGRLPEVAVPGDSTWTTRRPATTVVGSFAPDVMAAPGYRKPGDPPRQRTPGSVRISLRDAALLQTFPADYPWQGSRTAQWRQVGDAVPPRLAEAVLRVLLP